MSSGGLRGRRGMSAEPTEPVLEQRVRALEIAAQAARRAPGRACPASACMRAARKNCRWTLIRSEAAIRASRGSIPSSSSASVSACANVHMTSSSFARSARRVLERAREAREPGAREPRALADLQLAERVEDRLAVGPRPDRLRERPRALGDLVEEEILLRREVIEDRLLRHAGLGGDLGDGNLVEATLDEQAHRHVGDLLPGRELLRLPQAHDANCNPAAYCYGKFLATVMNSRRRRRMLARLAHLIARNRWYVIGVWIVLTLFGGFAAGQVSKRWYQSFSIPGKSAYEANQRTLKAFGTGDPPAERRRLPHERRRDEERRDQAGDEARVGDDRPGSRTSSYFSTQQPDVRLAGQAHDLPGDLPRRGRRRSTRRAAPTKMRAAAAQGLPAGHHGARSRATTRSRRRARTATAAGRASSSRRWSAASARS